MPQRFLKPGIKNSERWNSVSWSAQSLFVRILTIVDDYGRYDGRPAVIHGECFSLYNAINPEHPVKLQETDKMLQEIAASHLVEIYVSDGKTVLQINQWTERIREGVKERWPAQKLQQIPADSCKILPSPSSSPSSSISSDTLTLGYDCPKPKGIPPDPKDACDYGKTIGLLEEDVSAFMDWHEARGWMLGRARMKDWKSALRTWKRNGKQFNQNHAHLSNHRQSGPDRNAGTYNEGGADYSRLVKRPVQAVPDTKRPSVGGNADGGNVLGIGPV